MASFGKLLATHLASELEVSVKDVTTALENFGLDEHALSSDESPEPQRKPIKKKNVPPTKDRPVVDKPKESKSSDSELSKEVYPCERVKRGQPDSCGKNSRRFVEGKDGSKHWYCGGEKSGCYPIALKATSEKSLESSSTKKPTKGGQKESSSKKPTTNVGRKALADERSESLLRKVTQTKKLHAVSIRTESHGKLYYDKKTRILFDNQTQEAYGVLAEDKDTINPLDDENIRWLEANGYLIRPTTTKSKPPSKKPKATPKKKASKPESEDELELGDSEEDSDPSDDDSELDSDSD